MGLFKKTPTPEPQKEEPKIQTEVTTVSVNLTDKMIRVEIEDENVYLDRAYVKSVDDRIRITSRGIIVAEVTKRSKAYKELEPYLGRCATSMAIDVKTGDYGDYFRVKLKFESTRLTTE